MGEGVKQIRSVIKTPHISKKAVHLQQGNVITDQIRELFTKQELRRKRVKTDKKVLDRYCTLK